MNKQDITALKADLIKLAILDKIDEYEKFTTEFFYIATSNYTVRDLSESAIRRHMENPMYFAHDIGRRTTEIKKLISLVKKELYLSEYTLLLLDIQKQLATIVRGTKKKVTDYIHSLDMKPDVFEAMAKAAHPYKLKRKSYGD